MFRWTINQPGIHFYTLLKTLIACRDIKFFEVKTLLNDAFFYIASNLVCIVSHINLQEPHTYINFSLTNVLDALDKQILLISGEYGFL